MQRRPCKIYYGTLEPFDKVDAELGKSLENTLTVPLTQTYIYLWHFMK